MVTGAKKVSGNQRFYQLIHEITALLVGANSEGIDILVDDCLGKVGEFFQVSQVGPGQWSKAGKILPSLRAWGPRPVSVYLETAGAGPEAFPFLIGLYFSMSLKKKIINNTFKNEPVN